MGSYCISRSFFPAACTGNFDNYGSAGTGLLRLSDDPAFFQVLIDFMREDKYIMQRFVCSMY
jgi:hypothetical protein